MDRRSTSGRRSRRLPKTDPRRPGDTYAPLGPDDFPIRDAPKRSPEAERQSLGRRPRYERRSPPGGVALGRAMPHLLTAGLAVLAYGVSAIRGTSSFPIGIILVILLQAAGAGGAWLTDLTGWGRIWLLNLVTCVGLLPLLALQTTLAGAPYVALDRGSAGPALLAGGAAMLAMVIIAIMAAGATWDAPEDAGLLFLPAALIVPAILGARGDVSEAHALAAIAEVFAITAVVTLVSGLLRPSQRLLSVPAAVAAQFLILWVSGHGPSFQPSSGSIVPTLYAFILVLSVVLTVAVPILAWWIRRVVSAVRPPVSS